jgi:hypothetical protein
MAKNRFSKKNLQLRLEDKISYIRKEYDLPDPNSNGWSQIELIRKRKDHPKHSDDMRIYMWGEISAYEEVIDLLTTKGVDWLKN